MTDIEDADDFRAALLELLADAERAGVSADAVTGLLTAHLAAMRGDVRLPLSMPPDRAREFADRAGDHQGETMQVELQVSEAVLDDLELQLQVFEAGDGADAPDGSGD
ncbi:hypothetical protein [Halorientalis salina]|uniref:hypothetical protein n=1 Tax=Halorientalis salina TaxID=2932266 RepID=UPI0010AB882E|nr:hypothetical protein [Halorientalis salina]